MESLKLLVLEHVLNQINQLMIIEQPLYKQLYDQIQLAKTFLKKEKKKREKKNKLICTTQTMGNQSIATLIMKS